MEIAALALVLCVGLGGSALGLLPDLPLLWVASGLTASVLAVAARSGLLWLGAVGSAVLCWGALLGTQLDQAQPERWPRGDLARVSLDVGRGGCGQHGCWAEAVLRACRDLVPDSCLPEGMHVGVGSDTELPSGARVSGLGTLRPRARFDNPGAQLSWPDTRALAQVQLKRGVEPRVDRVSWWERGIWRLRAAIRGVLQRSLTVPHDGIARALLLGEGSAVEASLNDAIRNAGVSHVLAVSGMHVTLLVGAWVMVARWLWLRTPLALHVEARRAGAALGMLLAPLLSRLCGDSPSAARAAWTSTLVYALVALGLRPDPIAVASLVVVGFAALSPRDALHPGFVLSVLATAALLTYVPGRAGALRRSLRESGRAWLATAPFLVLCFGQLSWIALLANVALLPLGGALVPVAALHLLSAATALDAVVPSAQVFSLASGAFVSASLACSRIDPGFALPPPSPLQAGALAGASLVWLLPLGTRVRCALTAGALLTIAAAEWRLRHALDPATLRVTFLDIGQGDATLLESGGASMLIDAGGVIGRGPDPGARAVVPALRARRIAALDRVVLSHPHPDHFGGLPAVLAALPVRELWDTGQAEAERDDGAVHSLLQAARRTGVKVLRPAQLCGPPRALGRATLEVLWPCPDFDPTRGENDNSFVLRVRHGEARILLTGDVEAEAEAALSQRDVRADVLKVPHHGSRTSSSEAFLRAVRPKLAVISAGRGNTFGHPHPEVLQRLAAHARVLRTDQHGGVELLSDGRRVELSAE